MTLPVASPQIAHKAMEAEKEGDLVLAATLYEKAVNEKTPDEFSFNRLMIVYRKLKKYKAELRVINKAIKRFEEAYNRRTKGSLRKNSTAGKLSTAFMKSAGLLDKKGNTVYTPQPIARWEKRKLVVEKKVK